MKRVRVLLSVMLILLLSGCGSGQVSSQAEDTSDAGEQGVSYTSWEDAPTNEYEREVVTVDCDRQTVWGVAYVPKLDREKYPLVVCAHGLGGSYKSCVGYARLLAMHGVAAYCFDFRGGGGTHSDGDSTDMTLMTEVTDVQAVLAAARQWDFVDPDRVVLLGKSHGGAASAIAAARRPNDVCGLILIYPGFMIHDAIHEMYGSLDEVPDTFTFKGHKVGRAYAEAVWDYDVYGEIGSYAKPVLLMHGDQDKIVPVSYSDRAAQAYLDADYFVIAGAGHGFKDEQNEEAQRHVLDYLNRLGIFR
jgi:pimeloyl-ACP methyl ester carboxylesterase